MDIKNYVSYIYSLSLKLKNMPKLSPEDIKNNWNMGYEKNYATMIFLYGYYGYFSHLNNYTFEELNVRFKNNIPIYCLAAFYGKLKFMKYLEGRERGKGQKLININKYEDNNPYFYATEGDNIKVMKHLEQFNLPKVTNWKLSIYKFALIKCNKVKTLKYLESVGIKSEYSIGIINKKKNIKKLEYYESIGYKIDEPIRRAIRMGNIKLIKYLYKKGHRKNLKNSFADLYFYYMSNLSFGRIEVANVKMKDRYNKKKRQLTKIIKLICANNNMQILFM